MADVVSILASFIAVTGLGVSIAKKVDDFMSRWDNAEESAFLLQHQVKTFSDSLEMLSERMQIEFINSGASSELSFVKKLAFSAEGCLRCLVALKNELDFIGYKPGKARFGTKSKLKILWDESKIGILQGHLTCQTEGLKLLLLCREFTQQHHRMMLPPNQQTMGNIRQDVAILRDETHPLVEKMPGPSRGAIFANTQEVTEIGDDLARCREYLAFLKEAGEIQEPSVESSDQPTHIPKLPFAEKLHAEYHAKVLQEIEVLVPECPKLRMLILGNEEVGKSTLCSRITGMSEKQAGVSHRGAGTPVDRVWKEITDESLNKHLILHDSAGFQANSKDEMDEIQSFIRFRRAQQLLKDQLHCIVYCVSCVGARNVKNSTEKWFFDNVDTGEIPVFVVFTKFDLLILNHFNKWQESQPEDSQISLKQGLAIAEKPAFEEFRDHIEKKILEYTIGKPRVKTCRVALPPGKKEPTLAKYDDNELTGTIDLIKAVGEGLQQKELRKLWIAIQKCDMKSKRDASVEDCIDQYWRVVKICKIPIIPFICMLTLGEAYNTILKRLTGIWNLRTEPPGLLASNDNLHFGFLEATYDETAAVLIVNSAALATYNFGKLQASTTARIILKLIVGLTLIYQRLFKIQRDQGDNIIPFTRSAIREEARKFQLDIKRSKMSNVINKAITSGNCFEVPEAKEAARKAMNI